MVNFVVVTCIILATWSVVAVESSRDTITTALPLGTAALTPAPTPGVDCSSLIYNMADCLAYLSDGGGEYTPEPTCCSGFKFVMDTDADCICEALQSSSNLGIELNMTQVMALPTACDVPAPILYTCIVPVTPSSPPDAPPVTPPPGGAPAPSSPPSVPPSPPTSSPAPSPAKSGSSYTVATSSTLVSVIVVSLLSILVV